MESQLELKSEVELGVDLAKFKLSLNDFVQIVRRISGAAKQDELRNELKNMITEVRKSFDTVVDVFTPFFALDNARLFEDQFGTRYAEFSNKYLKSTNYVRTSSEIVRNILAKTAASQEWKDLWPILWRQYKRLQRLGRDWAASDVELGRAMDSLLHNLDRFLADIAALKRENPKDALDEFLEDLELFKHDFRSVKEQLDELDVISRQL